MRYFAILSLILLSCPATAPAQDVVTGRALFETHCATCHGSDARGAGPMAPVLLIGPPDLTELANKGGDVFPRSGVIARIDGRDPLVSHGSSMPVFGPFFEGKGVTIRGEDGVLIMTSQPIIDLISYLETLQRQP